jgi:NAD(P)-dependent dehydrogenase (short-subunit alcohol dehydrogenase family)
LIEELGSRALAVTCDVRKADDVKAAVDQAVTAFGRIDVAFNNTGVEQPVAPIGDVAEDDWDRLVVINLRGVFLCMKYVLPTMLEQGSEWRRRRQSFPNPSGRNTGGRESKVC